VGRSSMPDDEGTGGSLDRREPAEERAPRASVEMPEKVPPSEAYRCSFGLIGLDCSESTASSTASSAPPSTCATAAAIAPARAIFSPS
jgi:hypothetical protein